VTGSTAGPPDVSDFLDTNPVLRYLIQNNAEQTARATALIESDRPLRISIVTLAELGYVLTRVYNVARADAVDALIALLN
jgi:predicted nucleic acid-binding protein